VAVYDYMNRSVLDLQFRIGEHDAVNTRSLDLTKYNNNATWAAGASAPTKIANQRGYTFDRSDLFTVAHTTSLNVAATMSFGFVFTWTTDGVNNCILMSKRSVAANWPYAVLVDINGAVSVFSDNGVAQSIALGATANNSSINVMFIMLSSGSPARTILNGRQYTSAGNFTAGTANANPVLIGAQNAGGANIQFHAGNIYQVQHWDVALTNIQGMDWCQDALRRLNNV